MWGNAYNILDEMPVGKRKLGKSNYQWEGQTKWIQR
jgi:hypothetical protein